MIKMTTIQYLEAKRKRRLLIVRDTIKILIVCTIIFFSCAILADATSLPIQTSLTNDVELIKESQNISLIKKIKIEHYIFVYIITLWIVIGMLEYLKHGQTTEEYVYENRN
jgi:hypothetical protein